jgi:hypothetical protein
MRLLRIVTIFIGCYAFATDSLYCQTFLNSADGKSGVLYPMKDSSANLNYSITDSRLGFQTRLCYSRVEGKHDPIVQDFRYWDIDFGASLKDKKNDVFKGGDLSLGADLTVTHYRNYEREHGFYGITFPAITYQVQQVKAAFKPDASDSIALVDKLRHKIGIGFAYVTTIKAATLGENLLIGFSAYPFYEWKSTGDAGIRDVAVLEVTGINANKATTISNSEDRYSGRLYNEFKTQLRFDAFWNIGDIGTASNPDKRPTLGLLLGSSANISEKSKPLYNVSIGPTIQPAGYPHQIAFSMLFEVYDVNNDTSSENFVKDNFRVRVYVGVPFKVFE